MRQRRLGRWQPLLTERTSIYKRSDAIYTSGPSTDILSVVIDRFRRSKRNMSITLTVVAIMYYIVMANGTWPFMPELAANILGLIAVVTVWTAIALRTVGIRRAVGPLTEGSDCRAVGSLCDILVVRRGGGSRVRVPVEAALVRLIPVMKSEDAGRLTEGQRSALVKTLRGTNSALVLAVLKGLTTFNATGALTAVEKLAAGNYLARTEPEIRCAAAELLPVLKARSALEGSVATLLRAGPEAPGDAFTALRAVHHNAGEPESARLLRASKSEGTGRI